MASVSDAELKQMTQEERVTALGMRTEQLTGKSLHIEFDQMQKSGLHTHGRLKLISTSAQKLILLI